GEEFAFLWVTDFPMFKFNTEENRWESEHHPFTSCNDADMEFLKNGEYGKAYSRAYDLVLNGNEIGSGSIRIHNQDMQKKIFEIIGIDEKQASERFGFLLKAFQYGAPPHAGVAYGIDRLVSILTGAESIRDTIAFPKTQKGSCPLSDAPSTVDQKQLQELAIMTIKKGDKDA
ncbi:MAG: hypothetical protein HQL25_02315, partial [Candidatus Omnitrophica bacterium]|nr:hypothetical protein [Candidatus Omnitrophota bacterium]